MDKVLMFGWEYPPHISGGLGVACHGIANGLAAIPLHVFMILPKTRCALPYSDTVSILGAVPNCTTHDLESFYQQHHLNVGTVETLLAPYITEDQYQTLYQTNNEYFKYRTQAGSISDDFFNAEYGPNLISEVVRYAISAAKFATTIEHDIIHAHDWITVLAGIEAKRRSGKPLIFHVHALETDRNGKHVNSVIFNIERFGLQQADLIIAVSQYTKACIVEHYGIAAEKIRVVYNGVAPAACTMDTPKDSKPHKLVLFLGRLTYQKGPEYFIRAAKRVLDVRSDVHFAIAGSGDLAHQMIELAAHLRIGKKVHFLGFLHAKWRQRVFELADVFVMPSVSEPFGISCLEALSHQVPVVISKQSGVAEVITGSLKANHWDTADMAAKILALLEYPALADQLVDHSSQEIRSLTWQHAAANIVDCYRQVIRK